MTVYKSAATKYAIPFVVILVAATIVLINEQKFFDATICFILALMPIGFIGLSYKWCFVTADNYMQIDSIVLGKKINWNDIIAIEDMQYGNGLYLLRAITQTQMFEIPVSMLKRQHIIEIVQYMQHKAEQYKIPFNHNIPYLKSIYYQYNPKPITLISRFLPLLSSKTRMPIFGSFVACVIGFRILLRAIDRNISDNAMLDLLLLFIIMLLMYGWIYLLFAQFSQNLRAIEHNQREQHDQMFVPTVASAQPYRLPFVLVSVALMVVLTGAYWYLTN
ncbi:hypothetical protein [Herpetosiphon geysericola]|uniref:Uncharacterized protein n=1 Tax=Herpetosiphon geysericola TaxID=70996 RepID=A0A0P6XSF4_9CHLR|nr:hypothetical protein [Herpetosiphon geysericola]KPL85829.1 hypothetical protein SE18_12910 [Herpetosiphon geysericola]